MPSVFLNQPWILQTRYVYFALVYNKCYDRIKNTTTWKAGLLKITLGLRDFSQFFIFNNIQQQCSLCFIGTIENIKRTEPIHIHYIPHILTPSVYDQKLHFFAKKWFLLLRNKKRKWRSKRYYNIKVQTKVD